VDGCTLDTEAEKDRVIKCLEAAVQRGISEVCEKSNQGFVLTVLSYIEQIEVIYILVNVGSLSLFCS
jgi:hypothetical protein